MLKKIAYFAAGFVLGGVTSFVLTKKLIIDKMPAPEDTEVEGESVEKQDEEVKGIDISETEFDGEQIVSAKKNEEEIPNYSEASTEEAANTEKIFRYEATKPRVTDYSKYGSKRAYMDEYEDEKEDDSVEELEMLSPSEDYANDSEYISPTTYMQGDYEKIELAYYEGDEVLAEVDGRCENDVTEDVLPYIPPDYADHFGDYAPEQINVRSNRNRVDYEIIRYKTFYYEEEEDEE